MAASARILFSSPLVKVSDFTCDTPKSEGGCERCDPIPSITIIRRGVHAYHARGQAAEANRRMAHSSRRKRRSVTIRSNAAINVVFVRIGSCRRSMSPSPTSPMAWR
jgi:hypothetical protein